MFTSNAQTNSSQKDCNTVAVLLTDYVNTCSPIITFLKRRRSTLVSFNACAKPKDKSNTNCALDDKQV